MRILWAVFVWCLWTGAWVLFVQAFNVPRLVSGLGALCVGYASVVAAEAIYRKYVAVSQKPSHRRSHDET